jgi:hypothetical protein
MEFGVATGYARPFAFNCQYCVRRDDPIAPDEFKKVLPTKAQLANR